MIFIPPALEVNDVQNVKTLTPDELANVPFEAWRLFCMVDGCNRWTRVRDYGIWPELWGRLSIGNWINIRATGLLCAKHWKMYNKKIPFERKKFYSIDEVRKTIMEKTS